MSRSGRQVKYILTNLKEFNVLFLTRLAYILLFTGLLACGDEESANTPPVALFESTDGLDRIILDGNISKDSDGDPLVFRWTASDESVVFDNAAASESYFKITPGVSSKEVDVTLTVSDGKFQDEKTRTVDVPAYSYVRSIGLGKSLTKETSNNVEFEWYIDQSNTGPHSLLNCGPAAVTMAIKWFDQNFTGSAEDARNVYHSSGGWWYTNDIIAYLNKYNVNNRTINLDNISNLKAEIDDGNILIICLDMYLVDFHRDPEYHVNKFYETNGVGWGHFIVVKGYKEIDGNVFFETYDPYSFSHSYSAGGLKGKDRFYSSSDLDVATNTWWDYAIVVERSGSSGGRQAGVDISKIVHKPGR